MGEETKSKADTMRREYKRDGISEETVQKDPILQFSRCFREALDSEETDANAMTLSTATTSGKPSSRIVLLKGFDEQGFRFYTNYNSRKGRDLEENPYAALCFFWPALERQIRIEGKVKKVSRKESAAYFETRPRESQLGAWASDQSAPLRGRKELEEKFRGLEKQYENREVPLPDFWGGYLLRPRLIEFWQGRTRRLHDRILYTRTGSGDWEISRLSP